MIKKTIQIIKNHLRYFIEKPIFNLYRTDFKKYVLISYIAQPFKKVNKLHHTNYAESLAMSRVFRELGYNVDIVNYHYKRNMMYEKYDVIIGFGEPLINSYKSNCDSKRIYYGTGMHVCHQNHATLKRAEDVYRKKKVWLLNSTRLVEKTWTIQTTLVDAMIMFGNETVVESYAKYFDKPIYNIPLSCYEMLSIEDNERLLHAKDYEQSKRKFIFMSSAGMVHRSLDLLLEIFADNPQWELHICAPIDKEPDFEKVYYDELYNTPNIHTHGFIRLNSDLFVDLIKKSTFCVYPSCSEGVAGSVINLMAHGIVPIVTDEAGINPCGFVFNIKSISKQEILNSLNRASATSNEKLLEMSLACLKHTRANHSIDVYKQQLVKALKIILGKKL